MSQHVQLNELPAIHGAMAEFESPEELIAACEEAYAHGYPRMAAYAPMPVEGLAEAIGFKRNKVSLAVLIGGSCGAIGGFTLLEWIAGIAYPHNVGGPAPDKSPAPVPHTL